MKKIEKLFLLLIGFVCLLPCSAPAQQNSPATATATVYVYRLRDAYGALLKPGVFCDGKQLIRMRNGRFAKIEVPTGEHSFTSTFPGNGVSLDLKPGETYYVRVNMSMGTMFHASRGQVTGVFDGQGKFEVSQLKPAEDDDLKATGDVAEK